MLVFCLIVVLLIERVYNGMALRNPDKGKLNRTMFTSRWYLSAYKTSIITRQCQLIPSNTSLPKGYIDAINLWIIIFNCSFLIARCFMPLNKERKCSTYS